MDGTDGISGVTECQEAALRPLAELITCLAYSVQVTCATLCHLGE